MKKYVAAYVASTLAMIALDSIWLTLVAHDYYQTAIGHLMAPKPDMGAAAAFYVLYILGTLIFAVAPALKIGKWTTAASLGGLFGFFNYMTYDLTNLATLRDWPVTMVFIDILWGIFITACAATAGYLGASAISKRA